MPKFNLIATIQGTISSTVEAEDIEAACGKFENEIKIQGLDEWDITEIEDISEYADDADAEDEDSE